MYKDSCLEIRVPDQMNKSIVVEYWHDRLTTVLEVCT